jgi:hypothetical protein
MAEVADRLLKALDALDASPQFCVSGSVAAILLGLEVEGVGPVGLPISPTVARQLIEQATQAPYGLGEATVVDTNVRRVWQIEPNRITIGNTQWDSLLTGMIDKVKTEFGIKGQVNAELYKLLIYEEESFFRPHRDTEKVAGMFATLIVCLPARHEGGTLLVEHDRQTKEIDFGGPQSEYTVQYAAFYADCRHEIKPVTQGYRVCLVYNLALAARKRQPESPRNSEKIGSIAELLQKMFEDEAREKIAILLKHEYTEAGLSLAALKGEDRSSVDVLMRAAEQLKYQAYLALMTFHQQGSPKEETVRYGGRWGEHVIESSVEMGEVYEEELSLGNWIDSDGNKQALGKMELDQEEIVSETDFEDFPVKQEVHEATGNEGATVERWYRRGAVVVWPPDQFVRILARQGQSSALPALKKMIAGSADPAADEECRAFARAIIDRWKPPRYTWRAPDETADEVAAMLKLLEPLADLSLANQFIHSILPGNYKGTEGPALHQLGERLGWDASFGEELRRFLSSQAPDSHAAKLPATVSIIEDLCRGGKMTEGRKSVCRALVRELEQLISRCDAPKERQFQYRSGQERPGVIEGFARAALAVDEPELLQRFLSRVLADKEHYGLHTALVPAVKKMYESATKNKDAIESRRQLLQHCIGELERLTEKPVEEPKDWAQDRKIRCYCADCRELQQFVSNPQEQVHRFRLGKERRQHLHQQITAAGCDMTHVTERIGSPQTLVCTKTRSSYERAKSEFATNIQLLAELRGLERPKRKK